MLSMESYLEGKLKKGRVSGKKSGKKSGKRDRKLMVPKGHSKRRSEK